MADLAHYRVYNEPIPQDFDTYEEYLEADANYERELLAREDEYRDSLYERTH